MDEESEEPTEDDFLGKNGEYARSIAILHNGLNSMISELSKIKLTAGNGVQIAGEFPYYVVSSDLEDTESDDVEEEAETDWIFKPKFINSGDEFYVVPGMALNSYGGSFVPTISGTSIFDDPPPTLPTLSGGGCLYFKYIYDFNITLAGDGSYDLSTTGVSVEIVQYALDTITAIFPSPERQISQPSGSTNSANGNVAYNLFTVYSSDQTIDWAYGRYLTKVNNLAYNSSWPNTKPFVIYGP